MRKIIGSIAIILTLFFGTAFTMFILGIQGGTYFGHIGYCREIELPYYIQIVAGTMIACVLSFVCYILLRAVSKI